MRSIGGLLDGASDHLSPLPQPHFHRLRCVVFFPQNQTQTQTPKSESLHTKSIKLIEELVRTWIEYGVRRATRGFRERIGVVLVDGVVEP